MFYKIYRILLIILVIIIDFCDKCFYRILNDVDWVVGFVIGSIIKCDRYLKNRVIYDSWYCFNGFVGVVMLIECVDIMWCGVKVFGWLYGDYLREVEGVVIWFVCFYLNDKCCYYKMDI